MTKIVSFPSQTVILCSPGPAGRACLRSGRWPDILSLLRELGAEIKEREGSRVEVFLFGQVKVFHRPHPGLDTDKGAVSSIRKWLEQHGIKPWKT